MIGCVSETRSSYSRKTGQCGSFVTAGDPPTSAASPSAFLHSAGRKSVAVKDCPPNGS